MVDSMSDEKPIPIQDFDGGWHRQDMPTGNICIWSDKWMENHKKQMALELTESTQDQRSDDKTCLDKENEDMGLKLK
jgi:hypothetical protein